MTEFTWQGKRYAENHDGNTCCSTCAFFKQNCGEIDKQLCSGKLRPDDQNVNFYELDSGASSGIGA